MTLFLKDGNNYRVSSESALNIHHILPPGNYVVKTSMSGLFLQEVEAFEWPSKIYGDVTKNTNRILNTFDKRTATTGVLLAGEKGSGKTLLTKSISIEAAKVGIPTIIVNDNFSGDGFNTFLQGIDQPCILLFDEFEKTYPAGNQEAILTLLDGVFSSKKLFLFTCNDKYKIDVNMKNRPGRIFYFIEYGGLTDEFIIEYCNDNLVDKTHIDYVSKLPSVFDKFNFDMLKALVEEMNRYEETPQEALKILNIRPEYQVRSTFDIKYYIDEVEAQVDDKQWHGNPAFNVVEVYSKNRNANNDEEYQVDLFNSDDLKTVMKGTHVYVKGNKKLVLTKEKEKTFNYYSYLD